MVDHTQDGRGPLPRTVAWRAVGRCVGRSFAMLAFGRVHWPRGEVGRLIRFADGSEATVYRETRADAVPHGPCVLIVAFRLRGVHGRGHVLFRLESILNTPLFLGIPGFVSKLWVAHGMRGTYRGIYEWDGAEQAEAYARALWRVLALVSWERSVAYHVLPGCRRDVVLTGSDVGRSDGGEDDGAWWRVVSMV